MNKKKGTNNAGSLSRPFPSGDISRVLKKCTTLICGHTHMRVVFHHERTVWDALYSVQGTRQVAGTGPITRVKATELPVACCGSAESSCLDKAAEISPSF